MTRVYRWGVARVGVWLGSMRSQTSGGQEAAPRTSAGREVAGSRGSGGSRRRSVRCAGAFPVGDGTGPDPEERMWPWARRGRLSGEGLRDALRELGGQVPGLEPQLPRRHGYGRCGAFRTPDPGAVEPVSAPLCLIGHRVQVGRDGVRRRGVFPESPELGVIPVTAGLSGKGFPGQQSFAPDRQQPLAVQLPGMERPEAHNVIVARPGARRGRNAVRTGRRGDQRSSWLARTLPRVRTRMRRVPRCRSGGRFQNR